MAASFYEFIDHTADLGLIVRAGSKQELFERAAFSVFDIMIDLSTVEPKSIYRIEVTGEDREELMVNWLNELLFIHDARSVLLKIFDIREMGDRFLKAECRGEEFRHDVHRIRKEIKAATYHNILVSEDRTGWALRIIFDI
ncbi:MAG: archease [Acidobacteriota bacterium]